MTIEEWAKDFKSYVNELDIPRDDYKGIMEYIDESLALLKEQEEIIKNLKMEKLDELKEKQNSLLHEYQQQEMMKVRNAVKWE